MNHSKPWIPKRGSRGGGSGLLPGILTSLAILLAAITAVTLLISNNTLALEQSERLSGIVYAVAVAAGCFLTARRAEKRKLICAAVTAVVILALLVGIHFAARNAEPVSGGRMLFITACAWLVGGFLGNKKKRTGYA